MVCPREPGVELLLFLCLVLLLTFLCLLSLLLPLLLLWIELKSNTTAALVGRLLQSFADILRLPNILPSIVIIVIIVIIIISKDNLVVVQPTMLSCTGSKPLVLLASFGTLVRLLRHGELQIAIGAKTVNAIGKLNVCFPSLPDLLRLLACFLFLPCFGPA